MRRLRGRFEAMQHLPIAQRRWFRRRRATLFEKTFDEAAESRPRPEK
jgi:hypothetical protein